MKVTRIRQHGKKVDEYMLEILGDKLELILRSKGFITNVRLSTGDISYNSKQFVIDTDILPRNIRQNRYQDGLTGWTYTNIPTWDQRVEFNDTINEYFDKYNLSANIKSGVFKVRSYNFGAMTEKDWIKDNYSNPFQSDIRQSTEADDEYKKECQRKRARELRQEKKEQQKESQRLKDYPKLVAVK